MVKAVLVLFALAIVAVIFLALKNPHPTNTNLLNNLLGQSISFLPPLPSDNKEPGLINQAKNSVEQNSNKTSRDIKQLLYDQAQNSLNQAFDKSPDQSNLPVRVIENPLVNPSEPVSVIDLSQSSNIRVSVSKNTPYYLKFKNVSSNSCLYIEGDKYQVKNDSTVELKFSSSGTYPLKLNSCDLNDKNIGELIVQ